MLILCANYACAQTVDKPHRSAYFAVLPFWESPYQPFRGACPISEAAARDRVYLKLDYNDHNQVTAAHVMIGDVYKDYEGFFGHLYINAPLTSVSYQDSTEHHHFFDRLGNQISVMGQVYTKVYAKDAYGRITELIFLDADGAPTVDNYGVQSYRWHHEADGSVIEIRRDTSGEIVPLRGQFQFLRTRIIFGADGYPALLQNINIQGQLVNAACGAATLRYFYDSQGRFKRWEVYDQEGRPARGPSHTGGEENTFYRYDLQDIIFFSPAGAPTLHWSGAERWHFEIDDFGNRTSLIYQSHDGQAMIANNGYAQIRYRWSPDGRFLQSQAYFDASGAPAQHARTGIHQISYQRDERGLILETNYRDEQGAITERKDNGVARTLRTYDEKGKLLQSRSFNQDGLDLPD